MINLDATTLYLLLELLAVTAGLAVGLLLFIFKRHQQRKNVLTQLVEQLNTAVRWRRERLQQLLGDTHVDEPHEALPVQQLLRSETEFYQYLIKALLFSDRQTLLNLDKSVEKLIDSLIIQLQASLPSTTTNPPQMNSEVISLELVGELRQEIQQLAHNNHELLTMVRALTAQGAAANGESPVVIERDNEESTPPLHADAIAPIMYKSPLLDEEIIDITTELSSATPSTLPNADELEEIPDDLLQQDNEASNSTVTDIDALLAEVAQDNIKKAGGSRG